MEGEALPSSSAEAAAFVAASLQTWDHGGKAQLHAALGTAAEAQASVPDEPHQALSDLLQALLLSHSLKAHLNESGIVALFEKLRQTDSNGVEDGTPAPILDSVVDTALESIWGTDQELDVRAEVSPLKGYILPAPSAWQTDGTKAVSVDEARSRLAGVVRALVAAGFLSRDTVAERFDNALLAAIGLIENAQDFAKRGVRIRTNLSYKQQKFNLLREENEGYSALISEIVHAMGPPVIASAGAGSEPRAREQETTEERNARAFKVMSNISTLIGYYDLDPNRVLDLILEVFMVNYLKHWPFFLALLEASPWGRASSPRPTKQSEASATSATSAAAESSAMDLDDEPIGVRIGAVDVTLNDERGNTSCAQILGLKFQYFQGEEALKQRTTAPESIYHVAAHLIRTGIVRLSELRTHLSPNAQGLQKLQSKYNDALRDQVANARGNALTMASMLVDDTKTDGVSEADAAAKSSAASAPREPPNQVIDLVRALLALGQLKTALYILGENPWLCGAYPDIAIRYTRLLSVVLAPAYATISYATTKQNISNSSLSTPRLRYDVKKQQLVPVPQPRLVLTQLAPAPLATVALRLVFYVSDWASGLPTCSTVESVFKDFVPLLSILGVHLHRDYALFQQLCRLGASHLDEQGGVWSAADSQQRATIKAAWLNVIRSHLLPALSLTHQNAGLGAELWRLLRCLPYPERFALYGEWKYDLYKRPELRPRQLETEKEAKGILKRISKENVKESGRKLAKESHANPTIFFAVALHQVQAYDNLIPHVVESVKYLTHFEYDVFSFNLIDALSNPEKERTKQDGTNISLWLKSLAAFTGTIYKRQLLMDPRPVLQYIVNQLMANNSKDLVIVRELVLKMTGIEPLANLSDKQIDALTGGRLLRNEAMLVANAGPGTPARAAFRRTGFRLLNALKTSQLDVPLLILIAQQRQACLHLVPDNEAYLKYLGNLFDSCQEVLFQYLEFLYNYLEPQAYATLMPSLRALCLRFHIEPSIAFHIVRPQLVYNMKTIDEEEQLLAKLRAAKGASANSSSRAKVSGTESPDVKPEVTAAVSQDVDLVLSDREETADAEKPSTNGAAAVTAVNEKGVLGDETAKTDARISSEAGIDSEKGSAAVESLPLAADDIDTKVAATSVELKGAEEAAIGGTGTAVVEVKPTWHTGLIEAIEAAREWLPDDVANTLGPHFYVTFWQLALSDIDVPSERYEAETKASKQLIRNVDADPRMTEAQKRTVREAHLQSIKKLELEVRAQTLAHQGTRRRLQLEKNSWFPDSESSSQTEHRTAIVDQMYQHCIFPRSILSATDAIFAGKFIRLLQIYGTRNFSTYTLYNKILSANVADIVFSCTENEARSYSRFLQAVLANLTAWHKSADLFKKEVTAEGLSGFQLPKGAASDAAGGDAQMSHVDFCRIVARWHDNLVDAFSAAITSKEYMHVRNTIVVMTRLAPLFPAIDAHGQKLQAEVQALAQREDRGDLKVLAQGLSATLQTRRKHWVPSWSFRKEDPPPKPKEEPPKSSPAPPTPVRSSETEADRSTPTRGHELPSRPGNTRNGSNATLATSARPKASNGPTTATATATERDARAERQPPIGPRGNASNARLFDTVAKTARQAALETMGAPRAGQASAVDPRLAPRGPATNSGRPAEFSIRGAHEAAAAAETTSRTRESPPPASKGRQSRAASPDRRDTGRADPARKDRDEGRGKDLLERDRDRDRQRPGRGDRREVEPEREKDRAPARRWGSDLQSSDPPAPTGASTPTGPRAERKEDRYTTDTSDRRRPGATLDEQPERKRRRTDEQDEEGAADWSSRAARAPPTGPAASRTVPSQGIALGHRSNSSVTPGRGPSGVPSAPMADASRVKVDQGGSSGTEAGGVGSSGSKRHKINRSKYGPSGSSTAATGTDDLLAPAGGTEPSRGESSSSRHDRVTSSSTSHRDRENGDPSRDRNGGEYSSRSHEGRERERSGDRSRDRGYSRSGEGGREKDRDRHRDGSHRGSGGRRKDRKEKERDRKDRRAGAAE